MVPVIGQVSVGQAPLTFGSDVSVAPPVGIAQAQTLVVSSGAPLTWTITPITIKTGNGCLIFMQATNLLGQQAATVSDGVNTWAQVFRVDPGGGNAQMWCFQTTNASPSLAAGTITITFNAHAARGVAQFFEISGSAPSGGVVAANTNGTADGTVNFSTGTLNFTVAPTLAIAACGLDINGSRTDTIAGATFTQGVPSTAYPSLTTFANMPFGSGYNGESLQTVSLTIGATGNQAYSGTLSHAEADIGAIIRIKNPLAQ